MKTQDILLLIAVRYFVCKPFIQLYILKIDIGKICFVL